MQLVVDEIFKAPSRPRVAQNASSVLPQANLWFDWRARRVSICRLILAIGLSVAHPDHARSEPKRRLIAHDQPTPVPKGGGFVAPALLIAHGRSRHLFNAEIAY